MDLDPLQGNAVPSIIRLGGVFRTEQYSVPYRLAWYARNCERVELTLLRALTHWRVARCYFSPCSFSPPILICVFLHHCINKQASTAYLPRRGLRGCLCMNHSSLLTTHPRRTIAIGLVPLLRVNGLSRNYSRQPLRALLGYLNSCALWYRASITACRVRHCQCFKTAFFQKPQ